MFANHCTEILSCHFLNVSVIWRSHWCLIKAHSLMIISMINNPVVSNLDSLLTGRRELVQKRKPWNTVSNFSPVNNEYFHYNIISVVQIHLCCLSKLNWLCHKFTSSLWAAEMFITLNIYAVQSVGRGKATKRRRKPPSARYTCLWWAVAGRAAWGETEIVYIRVLEAELLGNLLSMVF